MSILNKTIETEPEARRIAREVVDRSVGLASRLKHFIDQQMATVWGSDDPQAIFDELGADAGELFALSSAIQQLLVQADPTFTPIGPEKWGYSAEIAADGTVTCTRLEV